jgi:hypothetical protein
MVLVKMGMTALKQIFDVATAKLNAKDLRMYYSLNGWDTIRGPNLTSPFEKVKPYMIQQHYY